MSPSAIASFDVAVGWIVGRLVTWTFMRRSPSGGYVFGMAPDNRVCPPAQQGLAWIAAIVANLRRAHSFNNSTSMDVRRHGGSYCFASILEVAFERTARRGNR